MADKNEIHLSLGAMLANLDMFHSTGTRAVGLEGGVCPSAVTQHELEILYKVHLWIEVANLLLVNVGHLTNA
jgi:hypothetical protein